VSSENAVQTYVLSPDLAALQHDHPVPGRGFLPVLSYALLGRQPILVDSGAAITKHEFLAALESLLDPADLSWIVLTHPDHDHMGALTELLERAPKARLVTTWVATGKLSATMIPPLPRLQWVNPGDTLVAGDHVLHFLRAPMYDCPSTLTFHDSRTRALFTSDAFGAFVPEEARDFAELPEGAALEGMSEFCRGNSPWLADTKPEPYARSLKAYADLDPSRLLSAHLPPVEAREIPKVLARAAALPDEGPVAMPGQQALDAALAAMARAA
jgi:glyoxylase-like metal-dependent hydrolase (beta-lactamase superfamily II)